jgi:dienelactone hydrolase
MLLMNGRLDSIRLAMVLGIFAAVSLLVGSRAAVCVAEIKTEEIQYEHDGVALKGFLAFDDSITAPRPGILVVHEWWGLNEYAKMRATKLAELGFVAFAADFYGEGKSTTHSADAMAWSGEIRKNIDAWQKRGEAGLDVLRKRPEVDPSRLAAIGYCFGGATVMQMAYAGSDLKAVVSFHGSLPLPSDGKFEAVKPSVLICHGQDDTFVPTEKVIEFQQKLSAAKVDMVFVSYAAAKHSFTNPGASDAKIPGIEYNQAADTRSWEHMQDFFAEKLK